MTKQMISYFIPAQCLPVYVMQREGMLKVSLENECVVVQDPTKGSVERKDGGAFIVATHPSAREMVSQRQSGKALDPHRRHTFAKEMCFFLVKKYTGSSDGGCTYYMLSYFLLRVLQASLVIFFRMLAISALKMFPSTPDAARQVLVGKQEDFRSLLVRSCMGRSVKMGHLRMLGRDCDCRTLCPLSRFFWKH